MLRRQEMTLRTNRRPHAIYLSYRSWEECNSIVGSDAFYQSKMLAESFFRDHQFGDVVNMVARAHLREPRECQPL